ncbi:MAG: RHS repeat-associated core domain-containing protein, partial [Candidatus Poribacteria bacterium]|nr:RHS repeat-associated core domain-containing protein [Candidatus Poribacteria bacterium]
YYFAARYYDPYTGRFNQRDPAGDGMNWYVYAGNNPLAFIDPTGLRRLSQLEWDAVYFVFRGTVASTDLDIEIVEGLGDNRGLYNGGKIQISADLYEAAGLNENSTGNNTNRLNPAVINYLSTLIHEAAHFWQEKYNRHTVGKDYNFTESELFDNRLGKEQHASAAQVYFVLAWQVDHDAEAINLSTWYPETFIAPVDRYDAIRPIDHQHTQRTQRLVTKNTARRLLYNFINFTAALRDGRRATTWGAIKR